MQRFASATGFKTKRVLDASASKKSTVKAAQGQEELHADMYASQQVLMEYSQHGLTDACSKILTQAGVQQQGLAALSQAFKQAAKIREVRTGIKGTLL